MLAAGRRLLWGLATLVGASAIAFVLMRVVPGDPAKLAAGELASEEAIKARAESMGLDQPLPMQYLNFVKGMFTGDWGYAYSQSQPARTAIGSRVMASVELGFFAFLLGVVGAVVLAFVAVYVRRRWVDTVVRGLSSFGMSVPQFWLALMLLLLLSQKLAIFPGPEGRLSPSEMPPGTITGLYTVDALLQGDVALAWSALMHLLLPAFIMSMPLAAFLIRLLRSNMLDVTGRPFMVVLAAKGCSRRRTYVRHVLPNASLPAITAGGLMLAELLAGSVLTEKVFAWPGLGSLVVDSVLVKDYAVVQSFVVLSAVAYIAVNTTVDVVYGVIDPRIRSAV